MRRKIRRTRRLLFNREAATIHRRGAFPSTQVGREGGLFLLVAVPAERPKLVACLHVGLMMSERLFLRELRTQEVGVSCLYCHTSRRTAVIPSGGNDRLPYRLYS